MGASGSRDITPQELSEFKKLNPSGKNVNIPELAENRTPTDRKFLIVIGVTILLLFPFLIYTLIYSDIRRLTYGTDQCGNLCGHLNKNVSGIICSGADNRDKLIVRYETNIAKISEDQLRYESRSCVLSCPSSYVSRGASGWGQYCYPRSSGNDYNFPYNNDLANEPDNEFEDNAQAFILEMGRAWWKFLLVALITIGLSFMMLMMLRYATAVVVWGVLGLGVILCVLLACGIWFAYFKSPPENQKMVLAGAIFFTICALGSIILLAVLFKRIKLVVMLYKEATKAIFSMPLLTLIPIITVLVQLIIIALFLTTTIWMSTSGELRKIGDNIYDYVQNPAMIFTMVFNLLVTFWVVQFFNGCQFLVIGGAVSSWYFAKNKRYLDSPIATSVKNLFKFHLGSIAFGSLIITLISMIRMLIESLAKNRKTKQIVDFCFGCIEDFIKFLSKNAYIEIALHGQPFYKSGKRAAKLLLSNAVDLIAVNSVGDFVLGMTQILLIIVSSGIAYLIFSGNMYPAIPTIFCVIIEIIIVTFMFAVFESTVDSLFICFCEDKMINDGISRPYAMSRGLMQLVEEAKGISGKDKRSDDN